MTDIIIYGMGLYGKNAIKSIAKYPEINLLGVYDSRNSEVQNDIFINLPKEHVAYKNASIVICMANAKEVLKVYLELKKWGFNKIYKYMNKTKCFGKDFLADECIECGDDFENEILVVETHLADHCNLNCKGCGHFSPLYDEEYPKLGQCREDIRELKSKVSGIKSINLLGGEPLLNKQLPDFLSMYREELPDAYIQLVTNGLLIPKLDDLVLKSIMKNKIVVVVSEYAPTHKIIDKICDRLESYQIDYSIRGYDAKQKFYMLYTINPNSKRKKRCLSSGCFNIANGKITVCPALMYVKRFNEKFHCDLPLEGMIDLKMTHLKGKELVQALYNPVPLCNYCVEGEIDWEICGKHPKREDFAWED